MSYLRKEISFPSADGKHTVHGEIYEPQDVKPRGILQISHGMIDYIGRYEALAEYLCQRGYIVAGNDHLGHGNTAKSSPDDYGFFAEEGGVELLLADLNAMRGELKKLYPSLPLVLMGHSMGSFLSRLYAVKYPESISGHIIHGTGGPMGAILPLGKLMVKLNMALFGSRNRSKFIDSLAFSGYNSKFPKSEGHNAWLTRELARVDVRDSDEFTTFKFTASAFYDLFTAIGNSNSAKWFKEYPKNMRTLIMAGDMDPVGSYGKGPSCVFRKLTEAGAKRVDIKLYPGARHELFNETDECRLEAFSDIADWLDATVS